MSIPKIMWQTHEWKYEDLPQIYQNNAKSWKLLNPGWDYVYHDAFLRKSFLIENNFLKSKIAINRYDNMDKQLQSEFWRAAVVYINGGAYIDMDSIPKEDNTLDLSISDADNLQMSYSIICTFDINHLKIGCNNSHFIGKQKSEFLKTLLDKYEIGFHKNWGHYNEEIQKSRLEFIVNSLNFARTALYRDDVAFTFRELYHGDEYKPENWRELTDAFYKI